ncbi:C3H1-type domain-containing protein, partial [Durusdinium trenchii]
LRLSSSLQLGTRFFSPEGLPCLAAHWFMAGELLIVVKNTFIDIEPEEKSLRWNRSWSCGDQRLPIDQTFASSTLCAPFGRDECSPDLEGLEGTEGASLGGSVEQTDTPGSADEAQENPTVGATLSLAKHNSGECSPCVFFASMYGCNSMTCEFCHLSHRDAGKRPRPRKQARDTYKEMLRGIFEKKQDPESRRKALQALAAEDTYVRALIIGQLDAEFDHAA